MYSKLLVVSGLVVTGGAGLFRGSAFDAYPDNLQFLATFHCIGNGYCIRKGAGMRRFIAQGKSGAVPGAQKLTGIIRDQARASRMYLQDGKGLLSLIPVMEQHRGTVTEGNGTQLLHTFREN